VTEAEFLQHYAIRSLGETFADSANRHDYDRFADLWTEDAVWEIGSPINVRFEGRAAIRQGVEDLLGRWDFFVQMPHAFDVRIEGDEAVAYWTIHEVARSRDLVAGNSNFSLYLDELSRTPQGWRFRSRRYRTIYSDQTALTGQSFHLDSKELRLLDATSIVGGATTISA
jgi:ketosteroid isomerase-like protein